MNRKRILKAAIPVILTLVLSLIRFCMLNKSPEPTGLDGYFYALQAKSFALNGTLENPSHEIGYYLCGIFSKIFRDPVIGCKAYSALSSACISLGIFFLILSLSNSFFAGTAGFLLSACSPCIAAISINYINNQTGLVFFLFLAAFCARKKLIPCIVFFILACISHKVTMIYSLLLLAVLAVTKIYRKKIFMVPLAVIGILCAAFLSVQFPRFKSAFGLPSLPCLHRTITNRIGAGSIEMTVLFVFSWATAILFAAKAFMDKNRLKISSVIPLVFTFLLYFPFWNFGSGNDMGFRLYLSATPFAIVLLVHSFKDSFVKIPASKKGTAVFCAASLLLLSVSALATSRIYNPQKDPPYRYYKKIVNGIELPDDSLLIAHLGLNHVYTYQKNLRWSLNYIPDFEVSGGIWRIAYGASEERISEVLETEEFDESELMEIDSNYILIKEELWQKYLETEDEEISGTFRNWFNPHSVRPKFIRRNLRNFMMRNSSK